MNLNLLRENFKSSDFERKMLTRLERLQKAEMNPVERVNLMMDCQEDPFYFIDTFGVVYEPRLAEMSDIPFFLFDYQKDVIMRVLQAEERGEDLLIEKTRDMGITWTMIWYILWRWLFKDKWYCLMGSRKEDEVDNKCYSDDTEVLTKEGWKLFKDVDIEKDLFATRNLDTHHFEWQKATEKIKQKYSGEFYHIHSRSLDLLVSPNHRVLYRNNPWGLIRGKYESRERIASAKELFQRKDSIKTIPSTSVWKGKKILGKKFSDKSKHSVPIEISGEDYCAFMGMYLAEGSTNKNYIRITQDSKSKGYKQFKKLLNKIFSSGLSYHGGDFIKNSKPLSKYLKKFGRSWEKYIPEDIMNATKEQQEIFLHYYMLGDGSWLSAQPTMTTVSKKMADQLQEIIQKIGKSSMISTVVPKRDSIMKNGRIIKKENIRIAYTLRIRESEYQTFEIDKTYYDGNIWCVSVPNTILYVRRNGKPAWSGNSPNSLFGKLRYAFYTLPTWMRPVKFRKSENDTFMKFMNPDKMSYVDGESANPNFARGKRVSLCFMDEIFFWKFARESWRAATDTSPVRIAVSTPKASSFARTLRDSFEEQGKLITLDWKKHPFKDETWYKKELERRSSDPLSIAAELEISYVSDPTLAYYPEVFMCPVRELKYNPKLPLYIGTDFGARDKTAIVYFQRDSIYHYCIEGIEKSNKPLYWFVPFLKRGYHFNNAESYELVNKFTKETYLIKERDYNDEELTLTKKFNTWNNPVMYCGETADLQTKQRAMVNSSTDIDLRAVGIFLRINRSAAEHKPRRLSTKKMLSKTIFAKDGGALDVYDALANSTYSKTRENSSVEKDSPVHDEYADMRSAVENYAVNVIMENEKVREFKYKYK